MILENIILAIYTLSLLLVFLYALALLNLLFNYIRAKKNHVPLENLAIRDVSKVPFVTIQLPVYNEKYMMERLLRTIAKMEYPKEKLEIQVLDDSTDETVFITERLVTEIQKTGIDIQHIRRKNRIDFKAGALKEGLEVAKGEFIAIFDADFMPKSDWLLKTVPYFSDSKIGAVQTRWGHINRDYSLLTKIQAFALDAHFSLEQVGRNSHEHFINFNGTAGIWRKTCILDSGNWKGDTLTEDLDLSYRAQFKGWKFKYLEEVETPAELPVVISAARSQQFRWNKGGAENFKKFKWRLLTSKKVPLKTKIHGFFHLLNSTMFLHISIIAVLSIPILYIKNEHENLRFYFLGLSFFIVSTLIFFISYWVSFKNIHGGGFKKFIQYIGMFFAFFSIAMGFSLHNTVAVLEGHLGKKSEFIRTPKFNINTLKDTWKGDSYLIKKLSPHVIIEGLLMLYFAFGMYSAFAVSPQGDFGFFPFHLMLFLGFGYVFFKSLTTK